MYTYRIPFFKYLNIVQSINSLLKQPATTHLSGQKKMREFFLFLRLDERYKNPGVNLVDPTITELNFHDSAL
jgi:hypothetical protein